MTPHPQARPLRALRRAAGAVLLAALAGAALAQGNPATLFAKPEDALAYRQGIFRLSEHHFRRLNASVLGRLPADPQRDLFDARMVALLAKLPFQAFVPGSDDASLPHSRARSLVWSAAPRFQDSATAWQVKADALPAAVQAGDLAALKKLVQETGSVCKKCHEQFRDP